ncbi:MAG: hypothetical protein V1798_09875 [Pseudomonadota bacterium]
MKYLSGLFLALAAAYGLCVLHPQARKFHSFPKDELQRIFHRLDTEVELRDRTMSLPLGGAEVLKSMRDDRLWSGFELQRRKYRADTAIPLLAAFGLGLLLLSGVGGRVRTLRKERRDEPGTLVDVPEAPPREEYVDEYEFDKRSEGGFKTREEAVRWLVKDPLLTCDYCGSKLRSTFEGDREALELVTFYKRVPEGARDMRIILGSLWFAKAASELRCTGCQRVIHR